MVRARLWAALFAMLACPGWATTPTAQAPALVVTRWTGGYSEVGLSPACGGDPLCTGMLVETDVIVLRTLSGVPPPRRLRIRVAIGARPLPTSRVVMLVRRGAPGRAWEAAWIEVRARSDSDDVCIETDDMAAMGVPIPSGVRRPAPNADGAERVCMAL
jgi:hypothetical protein